MGTWDDLMKMLVRAHPQDFVSLILKNTQYLEDITNELKVRSIQADFLCKADREGEEIIVHVEFQKRNDLQMGRRMWEYNCATTILTRLPVCSFALYLLKTEPISEPPFRIALATGEVIHTFGYQNIFFWEVLPEVLLHEGLEGMLPLLPLTKGAEFARDTIVDDMITGLRVAGKDDVLALGYAFAGLVYETESDRQWLKRRFAMFEDILEGSWSYKEMVQKGIDIGHEKGIKQGIEKGIEQGIEKGIEQGIEQGEVKALRPVLIRVVQTRFPALLALAQQEAQRITTAAEFSALVDKLLVAGTLEQARQALHERGDTYPPETDL